MNQQQLIDLATKHGLIILTEDFPKTTPNHQRLLSRLEKFAAEIESLVVQKQEDEVESALKELTKLSEEGKFEF